jgi:hypothetical protein
MDQQHERTLEGVLSKIHHVCLSPEQVAVLLQGGCSADAGVIAKTDYSAYSETTVDLNYGSID